MNYEFFNPAVIWAAVFWSFSAGEAEAPVNHQGKDEIVETLLVLGLNIKFMLLKDFDSAKKIDSF